MSDYQYVTGDELEDFAIVDYSVFAAIYTEAAVMGQVDEAEHWVNEYCKKTFTAGAAPSGVKSATLHMARYYMNVQLLANGHIDEMPTSLEAVIIICKDALKNNKLEIDYSSSATDFDLRNRVG